MRKITIQDAFVKSVVTTFRNTCKKRFLKTVIVQFLLKFYLVFGILTLWVRPLTLFTLQEYIFCVPREYFTN